jgi:sensor domain CHASE-containing protein
VISLRTALIQTDMKFEKIISLWDREGEIPQTQFDCQSNLQLADDEEIVVDLVSDEINQKMMKTH